MTDYRQLLSIVVEKNASDLHLTVGRPPIIRLHGHMHDLSYPVLTPQDTEEYAKTLAPERSYKELQERGTCDFGYAFEGKARFRTSIYHQKGCIGIALRLIPSKMLSFEELGLPQTVKSLLSLPRGLILVTGPTGSGKTTTLATMIDYINSNFDRHIITVEDPIEYFHTHKKSIITQREIGVDVPGFAEALRRALRQDPDVILLGEMRDLETISAAITAAETGHLVFGTLHTTGSARTVDRIIDVFPPEHQEQIRTQLAVSLQAVISQVLLERADGQGRLAAFEIMLVTPAIENHIRKNETFKITSAIQTGRKLGMILLDDFLLELYRGRKITAEAMLGKAFDPRELASKAGVPFSQGIE